MSGFKQYLKTNVSEMRPYVEGEALTLSVSIGSFDLNNGSPKLGDMVARNPTDHTDQWLVNATYFKENYRPLDNVPNEETKAVIDEIDSGTQKLCL